MALYVGVDVGMGLGERKGKNRRVLSVFSEVLGMGGFCPDAALT